MRTTSSSGGFTLLELILVVSVLGLLTALAIPAYASFRRNVALTNYADEIVSALRTAQNRSSTSQGGVVHGVHLTTNQYCLFTGSTFSTCTSPSYQLHGDITITSGTGDAIFSRFTGAPAAPATIVLQVTGGPSKTITIDISGRISVF